MTSGLRARIEWVMERRWWVVGDTSGDAMGTDGNERTQARAPAATEEGNGEDEAAHMAWAAAAAAEEEEDVDRAWEDAYHREMMLIEEKK
eukprot:5826770-Prymnesium_polylepis.1